MLTRDTVKLIMAAWGKHTSSDPEGWSRRDPGRGQDDVTALVIHDYAGGEILYGEIHGQPHYWNLVDNGVELDLLLRRYGVDTTPPAIATPSIEELLADEDRVCRYRLLVSRVRDASFVVSMTSEEYAGPEYAA